METFCLDAPRGTDMVAVFAAFRSADADMVVDIAEVEAYAMDAPDGSARLLVGGLGLAGTAGPVAALLAEIGTSRAAIATDWDRHGSRWTVLAGGDGAVRTVHRVTTLGVDHSDPAAVDEAIDHDWFGVDPRAADRRCVEAASELAGLYRVDPTMLGEAVSADQRGRGEAGSELWWRVLDLPRPRPGVGKPLH